MGIYYYLRGTRCIHYNIINSVAPGVICSTSHVGRSWTVPRSAVYTTKATLVSTCATLPMRQCKTTRSLSACRISARALLRRRIIAPRWQPRRRARCARDAREMRARLSRDYREMRACARIPFGEFSRRILSALMAYLVGGGLPGDRYDCQLGQLPDREPRPPGAC